jgi:phosphomannomutase
MELTIEELKFEEFDDYKLIKLPDLSDEEQKIVNPIVPPTSGLRIKLLDPLDTPESFILTNRKLFLYLRVAKAIGIKYRDLFDEKNPKILIVSDSRPSSNHLVRYCAQLFAYDNFEIYFQKNGDANSLLSSPYASASVALYEDIHLVLMITASHNPLDWNGLKFYIKYPIPISGDLMKQISKIALTIKEIKFKKAFKENRIDAEKKNNEYIKELISKIIEIRALNHTKIVIWPYLGKARGIVNLYKELGADVTLIEETINPPNPIKEIRRKKLIQTMESINSKIAILLDADEDRLAFFLKEDDGYILYIPNELYTAMHNLLSREFNKDIINIRTIPSDYRGDHTSILNILTGVGYKHLGVVLYFLFGIEVDQSKIDTGIFYFEENGALIKINNPTPLREKIIKIIEEKGISLPHDFILAAWEESGGHTFNILNVSKNMETGKLIFKSKLPIIADKYLVPSLIILSELIARGYKIPEAIDWTMKGINRTISAQDEEKINIMKNFKKNDGKIIEIDNKGYHIRGLSDNNDMIDIYQLKSDNSTLYFRPSGTGPEVRFYVFGKKETYSDEIKRVMKNIKEKYS